jgi:hypothetical protein
MKKLLFTRESACLQPIRELIERQKHRTLVLWVIDCAPRVLSIFESRYPEETRPRETLEAADAWARGEIKMPIAKRAAHAAHNAATAVADDPAACAAACAMGHVVGTVHVETHAMGLVLYGLTAFVYAEGQENADEVIARECGFLYDRLLYWEASIGNTDRPWAPFLLNDSLPNKERLLREKCEAKRLG